MKKYLTILLAALLCFGLAACTSDSAQESQESGETQQEAEAAAPETFAFSVKGVDIAPGDDMEEVLASLGDPVSYFEAESCAFAGLDKFYTYSGYTITTNPIDGKDIIASILLTDDSVQTKEGLYVGASEEKIAELYGEPAIAGSYSYENGCTIVMVAEDGKVLSIEYL